MNISQETLKQVVSKTIPLMFAPEVWGEVERFSRFYHTTYQFKWLIQKRLSGIHGNFEKSRRLLQVIHEYAPKLEEDKQQIVSKGFSEANRSKELAAVIEATFCSMYSTLDCFRYVFVEIYKRYRGIPDSTRKLFQRGQAGELDEQIPVSIREQFRQSESWFNKLRSYRDEMTHSDVGIALRDIGTGRLQYMHRWLGTPQRALIIEDVVAEVESFRGTINDFLGHVFKELNRNLKDEVTQQFCGVFGGRIYERIVKPSEATDFHGGICKSHEWFEKEENPDCPLKDKCGAYTRAKQTV